MAWPQPRYFHCSYVMLCVQLNIILTQVELNRKRENELSLMRKDFETQAEDNEKTVADLRKKHAAAVTELEEKVDGLQKAKAKYCNVFNNCKCKFYYSLLTGWRRNVVH